MLSSTSRDVLYCSQAARTSLSTPASSAFSRASACRASCRARSISP
jgi:hypothetical protein